MKTALEVSKEFKEELKALLLKYNTDLEIDNIGTGHSSEYTMKVYIPGTYSESGDQLSMCAGVDLGSYYGGSE